MIIEIKYFWIWIKSWFKKEEPPKGVIPVSNKKINKTEKLQEEIDFIYVEELPEEIEENLIYIVGENNYHWMLGFKCPCGCGDIIQLNLLEETSPQWKFRINNNGTLSISPSIWKTSQCKSHFLIKKGKVEWIKF